MTRTSDTPPTVPAPPTMRKGAWLLLVGTLAVVIWGAFVRASFSGAGCGDHWPLCNGTVLPPSPAFETVVELTHRLTSGLVMLGAVGLHLGARKVWPARHPMRWATAIGLVLMLTEALIGAGLVLFRMVADNVSEARGLWISAHLVNTFLLLAAQGTTVWFVEGGKRPRRPRVGEALVVGGTLVGMLLVGMSGAIAALGDTLFPLGSWSEALREDFSPTAHLFVRLRIYHPALALLVGGVLMLVAGRCARRGDPVLRSFAVGVAAVYAGQVGLGVVNVWLRAPVWMQLVHLAVADVLWLLACWMFLRVLEVGRSPVRSTARARSAVGPGSGEVDVVGGKAPAA